MSEALKLVSLAIVAGAGTGFAVLSVAIASSWKPEHTNALVYGLLSLSGLAVVGLIGIAGLGAVLTAVWILRGRRPQGADPALRNEYQVLRNTGAGLSLVDRLLARQPQPPMIEAATPGRFVDLTEEDDR